MCSIVLSTAATESCCETTRGVDSMDSTLASPSIAQVLGSIRARAASALVSEKRHSRQDRAEEQTSQRSILLF